MDYFSYMRALLREEDNDSPSAVPWDEPKRKSHKRMCCRDEREERYLPSDNRNTYYNALRPCLASIYLHLKPDEASTERIRDAHCDLYEYYIKPLAQRMLDFSTEFPPQLAKIGFGVKALGNTGARRQVLSNMLAVLLWVSNPNSKEDNNRRILDEVNRLERGAQSEHSQERAKALRDDAKRKKAKVRDICYEDAETSEVFFWPEEHNLMSKKNALQGVNDTLASWIAEEYVEFRHDTRFCIYVGYEVFLATLIFHGVNVAKASLDPLELVERMRKWQGSSKRGKSEQSNEQLKLLRNVLREKAEDPRAWTAIFSKLLYTRRREAEPQATQEAADRRRLETAIEDALLEEMDIPRVDREHRRDRDYEELVQKGLETFRRYARSEPVEKLGCKPKGAPTKNPFKSCVAHMWGQGFAEDIRTAILSGGVSDHQLTNAAVRGVTAVLLEPLPDFKTSKSEAERKYTLSAEAVKRLIETAAHRESCKIVPELHDLFKRRWQRADKKWIRLWESPAGRSPLWCDLRVGNASGGNTEDKLIREFETEFETNKEKCAVLIVRAPSDPQKWTIAGFSDAGKFRTVVIDDPADTLWKQLTREPQNRSRIAELATSRLGRTEFPPREYRL